MTAATKQRGGCHVCPWWLAYTFDNPLRRLFHDPSRIVGPYVEEGMSAVDVGCGMGYFTIGLARAVGPQGRVYALDLQQKMLDVTVKRAGRKKLAGRVVPVLTRSDSLNFRERADFALLFWAAHEFPDRKGLFSEIRALLPAGGGLLLAEPRFHVTEHSFTSVVDDALRCGFDFRESPAIAFSRTAYLVGSGS